MESYAIAALGQDSAAFLQKPAKNPCHAAKYSPESHGQVARVFWFFFAKKNLLPP
jgi:hypothetical protein